ncbi:uncharacterized protein L969DRAFT_85170 [Mixia osmundae IAM 14324]|uniref:uncharacterized protein n=1 Tax=Mixia osmundae (strain CBS 9802 / IAM 14324 / JCM 22182 / KY 12970) TaxID=764103 RepID=UPI0004A54C6E|nr:uncharacterized protein L969DRAFT_85170 [Mixia osmundae IAM 14324]KEI41399.1 hypothetical protein L969DRAFT_85170 [Mixia osmundae IAM 14324]
MPSLGRTRWLILIGLPLTLFVCLLVSQNASDSDRGIVAAGGRATSKLKGLGLHIGSTAMRYTNGPARWLRMGLTGEAAKESELVDDIQIAPSHISADHASQISLAYRNKLKEIRPALPHSKTLGFSRIYVISLASRTDRRARMKRIAHALGIELTFIDAAPKDSDLIKWIAERVVKVRSEKRRLIARARSVDEAELGGSTVGSVWLAPSVPWKINPALEQPSEETDWEGTDKVIWPSLKKDHYEGMDWVEYLNTRPDPYLTLKPDDPDLNVTSALWDYLDSYAARQVNDAVIATWHSQTRALHKMKENGDTTALVLEDDVDFEWDIENMWNTIKTFLPTEEKPREGSEPWEMVFLGHCWGAETSRGAYFHPHLYRSYAPRCLHGWTVSIAGRDRLLRQMSDPWLAYQLPVDTAVSTFIRAGALEAYSIEPPIIIQSKDTPSDIQPGLGSPWSGLLQDSTIERIWRHDGLIVPRHNESVMQRDPATRLRVRLTRRAIMQRWALGPQADSKEG